MMPPEVQDASQLRVALFSGNYNYVRDGANQALNRLVAYLLRRGVAVRVYSPTAEPAAFEPAGDLISIPSMAIPFGRSEYRLAWPIPSRIREDLKAFNPNIIHISVPIFLGPAALNLAKQMGVKAVSSMHTRFETYPGYYGWGMLEKPVIAMLRHFYSRCDAVVAPSPSAAAIMREQGLCENIGIWARGVDTSIFNPERRSEEWRHSLGLAKDDVVIAFMGRVVMEKGLEPFSAAIKLLQARGVKHKVLVIGEGPAKAWLSEQLPDGVFVGFQSGGALGRAIASADILFNPSTTETFGNVTPEAMASGIPVVAANAAGSADLVTEGKDGRLMPADDAAAYAKALQEYIDDPALRTAHGRAALATSRTYEWDSVNDVMIKTYLAALHGGRL